MHRLSLTIAVLWVCLPGTDAWAQTPAPATTPAPLISHRFLDIHTLNFSVRYRHIETSAGVVSSNHAQHQETIRARFTFDAAGHYAIVAGLGTGNTFIGGWNNAGIGTPNDLALVISLKQLYLSAEPVTGVELQYGGLSVARGENTEITSYDNDGYLAGGRISLKRPDLFKIDELSATVGYLGDTTSPNFLRRMDRLSQTNYGQLLVVKKFNATFSASADVTRVDHVRTVRSAFALRAPETIGVDLLRVEGYRRIDSPATGYSAFVEKAVTKRATVGLGTANVDLAYGGLNADRFGKGQRWFVNGTVTIVSQLSLLAFYQHAFNNDGPLTNRSRFEVILQFNALKALQRAHWY